MRDNFLSEYSREDDNWIRRHVNEHIFTMILFLAVSATLMELNLITAFCSFRTDSELRSE